MNKLRKIFLKDFSASIVVFLVALPLCLGIALASGTPLISGLIAGIIGGLVVGSLSGSHISVSGPAAGLTTIVLASIETLQSFDIFLLAVVIAGAIQLLFGVLKVGSLSSFFPSSVIKGMLSAIGLILILKQIPHAFGYDADPEGDYSFLQPDGSNTFSGLYYMLDHITLGAIIISVVSLVILIFWDKYLVKIHSIFNLIPAALIVVVFGGVLNQLYYIFIPDLFIGKDHMVQIPVPDNLLSVSSLVTFPDFNEITNSNVWITAFTIAIVASLETLLCLDATDNIDIEKRISPPNQELRAQGVGNMISGLIGGLPITAVIVRSTANIAAGAKSKHSAVLHGAWLIISVLFIANWLNYIPLASLSAILFMVGYKLVKPSVFIQMFKKGIDQFIPYIITIIAIMFTNLLVGICIGIGIGILFVIKTNFHSAITMVHENGNYLIQFQKDVSFVNKSYLKNAFSKIPQNTYVIIDGSRSKFIDEDIKGLVRDFASSAHLKNIQVELKSSLSSNNDLFKKQI